MSNVPESFSNIVSHQSDFFTSQIYDEDQLDCLRHQHSPLNEQYPDEFRRYLDLFYTYCPKRPFNVRIAYDRGFVQKNRKYKDGSGTYPVFCHPGLVARHLDPDHWQFLHPDAKPTERFWLAMWVAKRSTLKALDIDNKQNLVGYSQMWEGPLLPVVHIPLERFVELKRIYDEFPGHVWCISSETLGLHIWEKYPRPVAIADIHRATRPRLKRIGVSCEIHPMSGRCFRRPFGQDYSTITEGGLLTNWIEQLNYFEGDARTPSFTAIFRALRGKLLVQWANPNRDRLRHVKHIDLTPFRRELEKSDAWAAEGFPTDAASEPIIGLEKEPSSPTGTKANPTDSHCDINLSDVCQDWVQNCQMWAKNGLPCEDSLFLVVSQLARWLYFVELFHLPEDQRLEEIENILVQFCLTKNNGFISRLLADMQEEVVEHVHRAVESAISNVDIQFKTYSAIMRQKREKGAYQKVIYLEPLLLGQDDHSSLSSRWVYKCSISQSRNTADPANRPLDNTPLPSLITEKVEDIANTLRKGKVRERFRTFARRFLNEVYSGDNGQKNVHWQHINAMMDKPDLENRQTQDRYKKLLLEHGIIKGNWQKFIRRGTFSSRYRLTKWAYEEFRSCRGREAAAG